MGHQARRALGNVIAKARSRNHRKQGGNSGTLPRVARRSPRSNPGRGSRRGNEKKASDILKSTTIPPIPANPTARCSTSTRRAPDIQPRRLWRCGRHDLRFLLADLPVPDHPGRSTDPPRALGPARAGINGDVLASRVLAFILSSPSRARPVFLTLISRAGAWESLPSTWPGLIGSP